MLLRTNDSRLVEFKLYCDEWQNRFDDAMTIAEDMRDEEPEKAEKMLAAMKQISEYMENTIVDQVS